MFQLSAKVAASNWMQNVAIVFPKETKKKKPVLQWSAKNVCGIKSKKSLADI